MHWTVIVLLILLNSAAFAQTEISGEVSGVWTSDDSPYIVVDSTWVAEGDTLILSEGTRVEFQEGQGLYVLGRFDCFGTDIWDENSIYILVSDNVEHWKGLRFYGENETEMNFTHIECPDTAIFLDAGCSVTMTNSTLNAETRSFRGYDLDLSTLHQVNLSFTDCEISGGMYLNMYGGSVTGLRSSFGFSDGDPAMNRPGFRGTGTFYQFTNCTIGGGIDTGVGDVVSIIDNCRFLSVPAYEIIVKVHGNQGRMTESYVDGRVSLDSPNPFVDNVVLGEFGFRGPFVEVYNCDIRGSVLSSHSDTVRLRNSIFSRFVSIGNSNIVSIDSCYFLYPDRFGLGGLAIGNSEENQEMEFVVKRSVIYGGVSISSVDTIRNCLIDHNVILFDSTNRSQRGPRTPGEVVFSNNIFYYEGETQSALMQVYESPIFKYNCVWGFDNIAVLQGRPRDSLVVIPVDTTNFILDPLFVWHGLAPLLSYISPCIDAGDPQAPRDLDGTRSDMGAFYFHHEVGVKGILGERPDKFEITATYPNPFNERLYIRFRLPVSSMVEVQLYDVSGRLVRHIPKRAAPHGEQVWSLDGSGLASGKYYLTLKTRHEEVMRAITLIR